MNKLQFNTTINASKEKVWDILWNDATYRKWTAAFSEGSHAQTDWQEGSKVYFLDGSGSGMYSVIDKKVPNTEMTFKHLGEIKDGIEKEVSWAGAKESYFLSGENGVTQLNVEMDMGEEFKEYFDKTFPKALQLVKQLSEE